MKFYPGVLRRKPPLHYLLLFIALWTLPHLVDGKLSGEYKRQGDKDGKERERTAWVLHGVQGRSGGAGGKERETNKPDSQGFGYQREHAASPDTAGSTGGTGRITSFPGHGRPRDEEPARLRKEVKILREAV
jgi:hypothetical protein